MTAAELTEIQHRLKQYLRQDDIESVLRELNALLLPNVRAFNDVIQLESRYQNARREYYVKGVLKYKNEYENTLNHIREGLFVVIDALKTEHCRASQNDDPLLQALRELRIDPDKARQPVYLVNCDRTDAGSAYRKRRRLHPDAPFHFYLVQACSHQMPHSFTERLLWEEITRTEADPDARFYLKSNATQSLEIPPLPTVDLDAEATLDEFKRDFGRRHSEFFSRDFSHAAFGYAVDELNWDAETEPAVREMEKWLKSLAGAQRRYIAFFLVVYIENLHHPERLKAPQKALIDTLATLAADGQDPVFTHLGLRWPDTAEAEDMPEVLLPPVPREEIKKWLHRISLYGQADNADLILDLFDEFVRQKAPNRYRDNHLYDMREVQKLQELVCRTALQPA